MPKKREKTRANRKREKLLDRKNAFGVKDLTPANAVLSMSNKKSIMYK